MNQKCFKSSIFNWRKKVDYFPLYKPETKNYLILELQHLKWSEFSITFNI